MKSNSCIHCLDPLIDNGSLRVGGRLKCADLPYKTKHPAILPQKSHVTMLLIRHAHEQLGHSGRSHVISSLHEKYWIIKANTAVRHVISKCVFCRHNHGRPNEQKMADVPKNRISPAPPFTYTGVDYFGAFIIKEGRKEVKRYGALFTCLVSQAVHIKVASSLEPSSFIQALRHFITHRGPVKKQGVTMAQILSVHRTSCSKPLKKWTTKRCESNYRNKTSTGSSTHLPLARWVVHGGARSGLQGKFLPA